MAIAFTQCSEKLGYLIFLLGKNFAMFMAMVIACNGLHFLLKPYQQPRITSDIIVSFLLKMNHHRAFHNKLIHNTSQNTSHLILIEYARSAIQYMNVGFGLTT